MIISLCLILICQVGLDSLKEDSLNSDTIKRTDLNLMTVEEKLQAQTPKPNLSTPTDAPTFNNLNSLILQKKIGKAEIWAGTGLLFSAIVFPSIRLHDQIELYHKTIAPLHNLESRDSIDKPYWGKGEWDNIIIRLSAGIALAYMGISNISYVNNEIIISKNIEIKESKKVRSGNPTMLFMGVIFAAAGVIIIASN